jgi:hypothetical protein
MDWPKSRFFSLPGYPCSKTTVGCGPAPFAVIKIEGNRLPWLLKVISWMAGGNSESIEGRSMVTGS